MPRRSADPARKLGPELSLLGVGTRQALPQLRLGLGGPRPALHSPAGLEPGDRGREMGTRQPELGRKRRPVGPERLLLDNGRRPERAANRNPPKRPRRPTELPLDYNEVIVHQLDSSRTFRPAKR